MRNTPNRLRSIWRNRKIGRVQLLLVLAVAAAAVFALSLRDEEVRVAATAAPQEQTAGGEPAASDEAGTGAGTDAGHTADEGAGERAESEVAEEVHLTPEQVERLGIQVATLVGGNASSTLQRPATVTFDLDRVAKVGPRLPAKVVRVTKDLGDRVRAGETLATMSSVELGQAKAHYLTTRARFETQEAEYEREGNLRDEGISSEAAFLESRARYQEARAELEAASEALRLYGLADAAVDDIQAGGDEPLSFFRLTSPIAGVVQRRDLSPGQSVGPEQTPIHVVNVDRLWIMIDAFERDVPLLAPGQAVQLRVRSIPGRTFRGETDWISSELDPETRTVHVRAVVDNPDGALRPGMFGTAGIRPTTTPEYAMVPADAVQRLGTDDVVFVPGDEAGSFRPVPVRLGQESSVGTVEVLAGVEPGDEAVVAGGFELMSALTAGTRSAAHAH